MTASKIIIHCSDSPNGKDVDIKEIESWHLARGFNSVGYHLVIKLDGEAQKGRPLNEIGAHCEGENADSIGICLIGKDKFRYRQFDSLRYQIDALTMLYSIPKWAIYCHYQFPSAIKQGKTCPNVPINNLLAWYLTGDLKPIRQYILEEK